MYGNIKVDSDLSQTENLYKLLEDINMPEQVKTDTESFSVLETDKTFTIRGEEEHFNSEVQLHFKPNSPSHYKEKKAYASAYYNRLPVGFKGDENYTYTYTNQYGSLTGEDSDVEKIARLVNETTNTFSHGEKFKFTVEILEDDTKVKVKAHLASPCYFGSKTYNLVMPKVLYDPSVDFSMSNDVINNSYYRFSNPTKYQQNQQLKENDTIANYHLIQEEVTLPNGEQVKVITNTDSPVEIKNVDALITDIKNNWYNYLYAKQNKVLSTKNRTKIGKLLRDRETTYTVESRAHGTNLPLRGGVNPSEQIDGFVSDYITVTIRNPNLSTPFTIKFPRFHLTNLYWEYIKTLGLEPYVKDGKSGFLVRLPYFLATDALAADSSNAKKYEFVFFLYKDSINPNNQNLFAIGLNGLPDDTVNNNIAESILLAGENHFLYPANHKVKELISIVSHWVPPGNFSHGEDRIDNFTNRYIGAEYSSLYYSGNLSIATRNYIGSIDIRGLSIDDTADARDKFIEAIRRKDNLPNTKEIHFWPRSIEVVNGDYTTNVKISYSSDEVDAANNPLFYHFRNVNYTRRQPGYTGRVIRVRKDHVDEDIRAKLTNEGIDIRELDDVPTVPNVPGNYPITINAKHDSLLYRGSNTLYVIVA
jgi:hypothetical protein